MFVCVHMVYDRNQNSAASSFTRLQCHRQKKTKRFGQNRVDSGVDSASEGEEYLTVINTDIHRSSEEGRHS